PSLYLRYFEFYSNYMVKELDKESCQCGCNSNMFLCESCGFMYVDSNIAQQCEDYCNEHQSCSTDIAKHGVKCC
ncbi:MAG: hypothetical protein ACREAL_09335, partial [Nitrosopumilaceae archaeon]